VGLNLQVANNEQKEIRLDIGELGDMSQTEIAFDAAGRMTSSTLQYQESYRSLDNQNQQVCVAKLNLQVKQKWIEYRCCLR